jgi:hypothetical protein
MNHITISITTFGIEYDHNFAASSIPASLREQLDEVEVALDAAVTADDYPTATKLSPRDLVATQEGLDFKRLTELVNEPSAKPVLVVKLPRRGWTWPGGQQHDYYILDGHHRVASARLRGVDVEAVVVG